MSKWWAAKIGEIRHKIFVVICLSLLLFSLTLPFFVSQRFLIIEFDLNFQSPFFLILLLSICGICGNNLLFWKCFVFSQNLIYILIGLLPNLPLISFNYSVELFEGLHLLCVVASTLNWVSGANKLGHLFKNFAMPKI